MASFQYRAVAAGGRPSSGVIEAPSHAAALARVRQLGVAPLELRETQTAARAPAANARTRAAVTKAIGELSVLLGAGLSLDRALALAIENIDHRPTRTEFIGVLKSVREGVPLARAMAEHATLFPPMAQAMVEAGEANGRLSEALARLAETLERAEELRTLMVNSAIYPIALMIIATGVILLMLLFVVPQFESVFASSPGKLPPATMLVMGASRFLRDYGFALLAVVVGGVLVAMQLLRRGDVRAVVDRWILRLPQIGVLVAYSQTAQFARTLSVLVDGGVALPLALGMAQRSLSNSQMASAVARVADGLKEGGGLTAPLAATGVFPRIALGFFRTGEETSQLGPMLGRLADVLDRDVRVRLARLIGVLTPVITVLLGAAVAGIIAAVMTAIMGFNDLAVG